MLVTASAIVFLNFKSPSKTSIEIPPNHYVIFGYGSLLNKASLDSTLGRPYNGPFIPVTVKGWKRSWSIRFPNDSYYYEEKGRYIYPENIIYLNIEKNEESTVNGVLFIVSEEELKALDNRESVYNRIKITTPPATRIVPGTTIYTYVAKPEYFTKKLRTPSETAIRREYVDIVAQGVQSFGEKFNQDFEETSAPLPIDIVVEAKQTIANPYTGMVTTLQKVKTEDLLEES